LILAGLFILVSCSWLHTSQKMEEKKAEMGRPMMGGRDMMMHHCGDSEETGTSEEEEAPAMEHQQHH
jgi:hypothetical protein